MRVNTKITFEIFDSITIFYGFPRTFTQGLNEAFVPEIKDDETQ